MKQKKISLRDVAKEAGVSLATASRVMNHDINVKRNTFETVQLVSSKLLIFGVLTYLLILSAKNYLNHKHNAIVNKHRQNALMTYKAMVDATDDHGSREAILIQAAGCIFNPQTTGYTISGDTPAVSGKSMVEILLGLYLD